MLGRRLPAAIVRSTTLILAAVITAIVLGVSMMLLMRAQTQSDRRVADIMLVSSLGPLGVAAAGAPPGGVGSPHAVLGFGVLTVSAILALRFTGRRLALYTAIITVSGVAMVAALARMVALTGAVTAPTFTGTAQGGTSTPINKMPPTVIANYILRVL